MDSHVKDVVREITKASDEERITFPAVVERLIAAGVERYHADISAGTKTYYMPDGTSEITRSKISGAIAERFSSEGIEKAVRASQKGEIGYGAFCERIAAAGCVGYFVSLAGRRAVYYGRTIDTHVEWFPGARS